jgi:hypothetical protein
VTCGDRGPGTITDVSLRLLYLILSPSTDCLTLLPARPSPKDIELLVLRHEVANSAPPVALPPDNQPGGGQARCRPKTGRGGAEDPHTWNQGLPARTHRWAGQAVCLAQWQAWLPESANGVAGSGTKLQSNRPGCKTSLNTPKIWFLRTSLFATTVPNPL